MRIIRSLTLATALANLGACSTRTDPTGPSGTAAIRVVDNAFSPSGTTVAAGTTVRWTWEGANLHSVTFSDGPASAVKATGTYDRLFGTAGSFTYQCVVHGIAMSGTVTVQ